METRIHNVVNMDTHAWDWFEIVMRLQNIP